jgi:hypothetical protein
MISLLESLGVVCVVETAHWPQLARCENAWLRGAYRVGRGDAMTAPGLVCGSCGTELASNAKSYNQSAVPSCRVR